MKVSPWARKAAEVIRAALAEGQAAGLSGRALERYVSEQYPFGERAMHPYKVWLSVFRRLVKPAPVKPMSHKWPGLTDAQKEYFGPGDEC
jgi:hypothetical protein